MDLENKNGELVNLILYAGTNLLVDYVFVVFSRNMLKSFNSRSLNFIFV